MHSFITLTVATAFTALTAAVPHARNHYNLLTVRDAKVEALAVRDAPIAGREVPTFNLSPVGECGGDTGYGCASGMCCSQWGYCGSGPEYCGAGGTPSGKSWPGHGRPHGHGRPRPHRPHQSPPSYSSPPNSAPAPSAPAPSAPAPSAPAPSAPAPSAPAPAPSSYAPPAPSASAPSGSGGNWQYKMFSGSGSPSDGWPSQDSWMSFDTAFEASKANMKVSCAQWSQDNDSDQEIDDIKSAISSIASSSGVDERFILAIMMQESNGCVRVQTTDNGVRNPGLMQSHDGAGTCWNDGTGTVPCPSSEITLMLQDGVEGTKAGDGLKQTMAQCTSSGAQNYYQAAVIYNSGNLPSNLDDNTATPCYASDVANRLMGWTSGTSSCTL